ncbi:hypothetical protein BT63DRAFT_466270 [Microthyrium microscopicum]|uniref:F-box domain-containing protein n=1 Tax=Microthyrium microscopicum TaxID=703497 RepID=A0A6A6UKF4_9PEZI|nr:hypothetical protein BT63DRAFT_466270 [Microthyrium microscopicum]
MARKRASSNCSSDEDFQPDSKRQKASKAKAVKAKSSKRNDSGTSATKEGAVAASATPSPPPKSSHFNFAALPNEIKDLVLDQCDGKMIRDLRNTSKTVRNYVDDYCIEQRVYYLDFDWWHPKLQYIVRRDTNDIVLKYTAKGVRKATGRIIRALEENTRPKGPSDLKYLSTVKVVSIQYLKRHITIELDNWTGHICQLPKGHSCLTITSFPCLLKRWCPNLEGIWNRDKYYKVDFNASGDAKCFVLVPDPPNKITQMILKPMVMLPELSGPLAIMRHWHTRHHLAKAARQDYDEKDDYVTNSGLQPRALKKHVGELEEIRVRRNKVVKWEDDLKQELHRTMGLEYSEKFVRFALRLERQLEDAIIIPLSRDEIRRFEYSAAKEFLCQHNIAWGDCPWPDGKYFLRGDYRTGRNLPTARALLDMVRESSDYAAIVTKEFAYYFDKSLGRWKTKDKYSVSPWAKQLGIVLED